VKVALAQRVQSLAMTIYRAASRLGGGEQCALEQPSRHRGRGSLRPAPCAARNAFQPRFGCERAQLAAVAQDRAPAADR
jgi:hypothetical protein